MGERGAEYAAVCEEEVEEAEKTVRGKLVTTASTCEIGRFFELS